MKYNFVMFEGKRSATGRGRHSNTKSFSIRNGRMIFSKIFMSDIPGMKYASVYGDGGEHVIGIRFSEYDGETFRICTYGKNNSFIYNSVLKSIEEGNYDFQEISDEGMYIFKKRELLAKE